MTVKGNTDEAVRFLVDHAQDNAIVVTAIPARGGATVTRSFRKSATDGLRRFIDDNQGQKNLFFTVNPVRKPMRTKPKKEHIAAIAYFHVDCDPREEHDLEAERERILDMLNGFSPRPTGIIDSGNGYQGFWRLGEPLPNAGDYKRLEAINKQLEAQLCGDACANIDRLLRIPGTVNLPTKKKEKLGRVPVWAKLVYWEGGTVSEGDFAELPIRFLALLKKNKKLKTRWAGDDTGLRDTSRSGFDESIVAMLKRAGVSREEAKSILSVFPFGQYSAEKDLRIFDRCWESAASDTGVVQEIETAIDEINKEFALVLTGGKVAILKETDHRDGGTDFDLLGLDAFRAWFKNRFCASVAADGTIKPKPQAEIWLAHPRRRQYGEIVFSPTRDVPGAYNMWRGFAIEPKEGDCLLFLAHLRDNVCQGVEELYEYVIAWFAALVQKPGEKVGTSMVLRGRQGTGKTLVGDVMGRLLGRHHKLVASLRYVTGRFNAHLKDCLLLQADEAFWAGDHAAAGSLKSLITSVRIPIEFKGRETIWIDNHVRLLITSNAPWVVPAGMEERRFVVLEVGENRMQDQPYFSALVHQIDSGGAEALLHYLLNHDYSGVDLRTVPTTSALRDQKAASLPSELQWLRDLLARGALPGDEKGEGRCPARLLYDNYVDTTNKVGQRRKAWEMEVSRLMREWIPNIKKKDGNYTTPFDGEKRGNVWYFPPLDECRKAFDARTGEVWDWEEREGWMAEGTDEM